MTLGQTWVHINPTLGLNVVSLAENISKLDPIIYLGQIWVYIVDLTVPYFNTGWE